MANISPTREAVASVVTLPGIERPGHRFDPQGDKKRGIKYLLDRESGLGIGRLYLRNTVSLLGISRQGNQTVAVFDQDESRPPKTRSTSEDIIHTGCDQAVLKRAATLAEIEAAPNYGSMLEAIDPRYLRVVELLRPTDDRPDFFTTTGLVSGPFVELAPRVAQLV